MSESRLAGVPIFAVGTHRDKPYTERDLDDVVENFKRFSCGRKPRLAVPAVLGHDEDQVTLRGSGLPAAAWAERVYREGGTLYADFAGVPAKVMRLLKGRVYRKVSAELYDEPPKGLTGGGGKTLRRVAFLGGDIPQVKSLDDIPVPEAMSERFATAPGHSVKFASRVKMPDGAYACFSEVQGVAMGPDQTAAGGGAAGTDQMLAALQGMGADVSVFQGVPAPALAEVLRLCDAMKAAQKPADMSDDQDADDLPEPKDDEEKGMLADRAMKMAERARKFWEKYVPGRKFGEGTDTKVIEDELAKGKADDDKGAEKMSEAAIAAMVQKAVEAALGGKVKGDIDRLTRFAEEQKASQKRLAIDAFCEAERAAGRILPYELDPKSKTNVRDRLFRADATAVVHSYSEGGRKVEKTELDLQMDEIRARKPFRFGEAVRSGTAGGAADPDAEVERVERFSESPHMARALEAGGKTPADFVKGFKKAKEADPTMTAARYGVPDGF